MRDEASIIIQTTDGKLWPIHGPGSERQQVRLTEGALKEFYKTPQATTYKERSGEGGALFMGSRDLPIRFTLRIDAFGVDWDRLMAQFLAGLSTSTDAVVIHRTKRWGERRLVFRLEEAASYTRSLDPYSLESAAYDIPVIAPLPYWKDASETTDEWQFTGEGFVGELRIDNPGDVAVWPKYALTSPAAWIVPDVDWDDRNAVIKRMIPLRFQPAGRDALVDTNPIAETITTTDDTLDMWMGDGPLHFLNPIPPRTTSTTIPIALDPIPALPWILPMEWKQWLAQRLHDFLREIGADAFMQLPPDEIGSRITAWVKAGTPSWVPTIGDGLLAELTGKLFADAIRDHYGSFGNVRGATAQVVLERRYSAPWG